MPASANITEYTKPWFLRYSPWPFFQFINWFIGIPFISSLICNMVSEVMFKLTKLIFLFNISGS
jgi:hypothetical protein